MSLDELKRLVLPAASDAVLFLWACFPLLAEALELIAAWGFTYKSVGFVWIKLNPRGVGLTTGLGHWSRSNAEVCLLGVRGRPRPVSHRVHSVVIAPRGRHSEKPDEVRRRIEELTGPGPKLELFARKRVPGWDAFGNEVPGSITLERRLPGPLLSLPVSRRVATRVDVHAAPRSGEAKERHA
jgi:site-specific DNA-methyltransferase (adenine-specific)